jgi:hypothetical protein
VARLARASPTVPRVRLLARATLLRSRASSRHPRPAARAVAWACCRRTRPGGAIKVRVKGAGRVRASVHRRLVLPRTVPGVTRQFPTTVGPGQSSTGGGEQLARYGPLLSLVVATASEGYPAKVALATERLGPARRAGGVDRPGHPQFSRSGGPQSLAPARTAFADCHCDLVLASVGVVAARGGAHARARRQAAHQPGPHRVARRNPRPMCWAPAGRNGRFPAWADRSATLAAAWRGMHGTVIIPGARAWPAGKPGESARQSRRR